jgi:hypothetical protein
VTGYLITGRYFHRFQAETPNTWRPSESWQHYQYAALARMVACIGIALLFAALASHDFAVAASPVFRGIGFGGILWFVTALPLVLEASIFVNWHRGFVAGLLLDWLVVFILAGVCAAVATGT